MIRKKISALLGLHIGEKEGDWDNVFQSAETVGRLNKAVTNKIILELCKSIEKLEKENE